MRFFLTGLSGFAGVHLAAYLLERGHDIGGLAHRTAWSSGLAALHARFPQFTAQAVATGDVRDGDVVGAALRRFVPDGVFHLAGQSSVSGGEEAAADTVAVNVLGTLHVLAAARASGGKCRVLVVSSGEVYGRAATAAPVGESTPVRPVSVYAASKAAAEVMARQAVDGYGADVVCARAFNHTGPGQASRFVCAAFARQVAEIDRRGSGAIRVGNLDAVRDFLDVRDVVHAYERIWHQGKPGETYNVSSGIGRRIADVLDGLRHRAKVVSPVEVDPQRLRPVDVPVLVGDNARLRALGWRPTYDWEHTLDDLLADWRVRGDE